jgi:hypothetical protein
MFFGGFGGGGHCHGGGGGGWGHHGGGGGWGGHHGGGGWGHHDGWGHRGGWGGGYQHGCYSGPGLGGVGLGLALGTGLGMGMTSRSGYCSPRRGYYNGYYSPTVVVAAPPPTYYVDPYQRERELADIRQQEMVSQPAPTVAVPVSNERRKFFLSSALAFMI